MRYNKIHRQKADRQEELLEEDMSDDEKNIRDSIASSSENGDGNAMTTETFLKRLTTPGCHVSLVIK